jgi:hypothetical protein
VVWNRAGIRPLSAGKTWLEPKAGSSYRKD